ncbi:Uncharacterised protein [Mycobacteroides abscessus subsp. massiliense]|nr:Uncharacterised protein [Mycobacteroides abscessus subsp. massiliense]
MRRYPRRRQGSARCPRVRAGSGEQSGGTRRSECRRDTGASSGSWVARAESRGCGQPGGSDPVSGSESGASARSARRGWPAARAVSRRPWWNPRCDISGRGDVRPAPARARRYHWSCRGGSSRDQSRRCPAAAARPPRPKQPSWSRIADRTSRRPTESGRGAPPTPRNVCPLSAASPSNRICPVCRRCRYRAAT